MKKRIIISLCLLVFCLTLNSCGFVHKEQDEMAFEYDVTSGKKVSPENNPLLPYGWHMYIGWNTYIFRVTSQAHQYNLTAEVTPSSPYDEAASFDSKEGASIKVNFTIMGHVDNIYKFYNNYGNTQYLLPSEFTEIKDSRIYEAIREAGHYALKAYGELACTMSATDIKKGADVINADVKSKTRTYMEQFGFSIDDVFLSGQLTFPGGDAITKAYSAIGEANTEVEEASRDKEKMMETKKSMIERGKREADRISSEATREANRLTSEAEAIAVDLKQSIAQIGLENTMDQFIGRELAKLVSEGIIPEAILTQESILGAPFYNKKMVK